LITFGQLFLAVSLPTVVALVGVILNQSSSKELSTEVKNFRIEMAKELGAISTRLAIVETKLSITPPTKAAETKEVAA